MAGIEKGGAFAAPPILTSNEWELEDELASELDVAASGERSWHVSGVDFSLTSPGEQVGVGVAVGRVPVEVLVGVAVRVGVDVIVRVLVAVRVLVGVTVTQPAPV